MPDLGEMKTCSRAPVARRSGLKSGVCFPIMLNGKMIGTMDFFTEERISPSANRLDALRNVGRLVSSAMEKVDQQARIDQAKKDLGAKVNQLMKVARAAAEGDLTVEVGVRGDDDMGRLGEALARMIGDLKNVIGQVIESASQFAEGSRVVAESASYLSESAQNQAATVEEMSASIQQLSHSIVEINQNADAATALADKTSHLAKQGGDSVEQAIEAMVLIKKSSEQVSDIIQVISEIASQTNLLALERGDRGGPGRRARPGLRRRRRRGPEARRALQRRRQGDHRADQGIDPPRRRRRPAFGKGRRVAGPDRPGRPGDRRQHHQDRPGDPGTVRGLGRGQQGHPERLQHHRDQRLQLRRALGQRRGARRPGRSSQERDLRLQGLANAECGMRMRECECGVDEVPDAADPSGYAMCHLPFARPVESGIQ